MQNRIKALAAMANRRSVAALVLLSTAAVQVHAALPASVGTTVATISTDATSIFDLIFPVVASIAGLVIVIKLFKKFTSKI